MRLYKPKLRSMIHLLSYEFSLLFKDLISDFDLFSSISRPRKTGLKYEYHISSLISSNEYGQINIMKRIFLQWKIFDNDQFLSSTRILPSGFLPYNKTLAEK